MKETVERQPDSNLRRGGWKPGQSGNPAGRPKNIKYISEMLRERLDQVPDIVDGKPNKKTWREIITDALFNSIRKGSHPGFIRELLDRTEGKVTDTVRFESPLTIEVERVVREKNNLEKGE